MFIVYEDMSISLNRGDVGVIPVPQSKDGDYGYSISAGDILRIRVFPKKKCEEVALVKDFLVETATSVIELELDGTDTKIGDIINKPTTYWYEIELNPDTHPQTIVGYNEDGPKIFMLYPEGDDSGELPSINTGKKVTVSDEAVESIINNEIFQEALKKVVSVIEQHYNSESSKAQSGTAVAEAVKELHDTVAKWMTDMKNNVVVPGDNEVKEYVDEEIKKVVFGSDSDITDEKLAELIAEYINNNPVITIDDQLSETSTNPVQNKVIYQIIVGLLNDIAKAFTNAENNIKQDIFAEVNENAKLFVIKEEGKGLSSNDFTDEYKEKLDNIDDTLEDVIANIDGIPDYWLDTTQPNNLIQGANSIRQAMESAGRNKSAFLFYTDAHWGYGSGMSPKLLKYLGKHTAINKTIFGGDFCNTYTAGTSKTMDEWMEVMREYKLAIRDIPNHHSVVGNHDKDVTAINNDKALYSFLFAPEETNDIVRGGDFFYYIDDKNEKTRYFYLDTGLKIDLDKQLSFLINELKTVPSGWHIIVVSHIWFSYYDSNEPTVGEVSENIQKFTDLFRAYNERESGNVTIDTTTLSYNFTSCEGKVEFCIGGHTHVDFLTVSNGIPIILCRTDSRHLRDASSFPYTEGTTTESAVSGIVADYDARKVKIVRVGRGNSSEVDLDNPTMENRYSIITNLTNVSSSSTVTKVAEGEAYSTTLTVAESYEMTEKPVITMGGVDVTDTVYDEDSGVINIPSVTGNVVISATAVSNETPEIVEGNLLGANGKAYDVDGVTIYNGKGYKDKTRWSQSQQKELSSDNTSLTGWISVTQGDIIRLKNITFTEDTTNVVLWSNAIGSTNGSANYATLVENREGQTENGNIIQFTVGKDVTYIRIVSTDINENSIITVNREI